MATSIYKGTFTANTATGSQTITGIVDAASAAFTPVAVILWTTGQTSADTYGGDQRLSYGFATGSSAEWCSSIFSEESGSVGAPVRGISATACVRLFLDDGPTVDGEADFTSFGSGEFTINWSNAPAAAWVVHFIAIGGAGVTAHVGAGTLATSGATQGYTGAGFVPELVLFAGLGSTGVAGADSIQLGAICLGASDGTNSAMTMIGEDAGVSAMTCVQYQKSGAVLVGSNSTSIGLNYEADLDSMDADGFTLSVSDLPSADADFGWLALAGGDFKVGLETQKTSTGTKATTGVGFKPAGALFVSGSEAANGTFDATVNSTLVVGASDGNREGVTWGGQDDGNANSVAKSNYGITKSLRMADAGASPTTLAEADFATFDADGFTLDWTTADGTAREFWWVAFGPAAAGGGTNRRRRFFMAA